MAIHKKHGVAAISVKQLLAQELQIPPYQRPYNWKPETALQLVNDIQMAMNDPHRRDTPYVLGAVILHKEALDTPFNVVDGQQRLLTLHMILAILSGNAHTLQMPDVISDEPDTPPVQKVWKALTARLRKLSANDQATFAMFTETCCQVIRIETDDLDEAFRIFDSQNYRGKSLAPHDLLKAYHLREMDNESAAMKSAVVETWESAKDSDLERLFATYLYRIARWARKQRAPEFTIHDISLFKGISPRDIASPYARHHAAAQTILPGLAILKAVAHTSTPATDNYEARIAAHSRFQIDAPMLAGRHFFEMVSFMLKELKQIINEGYTKDSTSFCFYELQQKGSSHSVDGSGEIHHSKRVRYRYITELYIAALLYYTNRFGPQHQADAQEKLFSWAYALRVNLQRVQYLSVDRLACGDDDGQAVFALIRDASHEMFIHQIKTNLQPHSNDHEVQLLKYLQTF